MSGRPALRPERLALLLVVGFLGAFLLVPAGYLFASSLAGAGGLESVARLLEDPGTTASIGQSLVQGGLSAVLAVAVGYPAGVFIGRYAWRGRGAVRTVLLVPFLLPSLVVVVGLLDLVGPAGLLGGPLPALRVLSSGLPAIVAVNLLFNVPLVLLFTASGCEASSPELEETVATLGGGPGRAYLEVWARPSATGAACGGLLTFVFSALSFAPPILLCGPRCATVEVRVWELAAGAVPDPNAAGVLSLLLVLLFLAPAVAYLLLARALAPSYSARAVQPRPVDWRHPVTWGLVAPLVVLVGSVLLLFGAVFSRSVAPTAGGGVGHGWALLFAPSTASRLGLPWYGVVGNSLLFATLAAGVGLLVALAAAFVGSRRPRGALLLGTLAFVPVLLSPIVLAFALAESWGPLLGGAANTWILIVLSQGLTALPFALQSLELPLASVPPSGRESAETLGAGPWAAFVDAELPRVAAGVERAGLFALALGLGEFTATYFLVTPSLTTLPVAVYALETRGLFGASAAAAALLLLLSLAVYAVVVVGARRAAR